MKKLLDRSPINSNKFLTTQFLGVIQTTSSGERLVDVIRRKGVVPGIKLDLGVVPLGITTIYTLTKTIVLAGTLSEGTTQGKLFFLLDLFFHTY